LVLVVHLKATAPPARRSPFPEQLLAGFVEADHRIPRVVGQQVGLDHVFHAPDELGIGVRRDTPGRDDPGLAGVFFSACRTASTLTRSTRPSTTRSSAKSCKVQWQRPSGGSLQASWISFRSTSPVILISPGRAGWGRWSRAAGSPSVTNRRRTRPTVRRLIPRERTMAVAGRSSPGDVSASRRTRAWISLRAAPLPTLTSCSKAARSSASKGPRYLSMAAPVLEVRHSPDGQEREDRPTRQSKIDGPLGCKTRMNEAATHRRRTQHFRSRLLAKRLSPEESWYLRTANSSKARSRLWQRSRRFSPRHWRRVRAQK